jgi:hypothetical protein
VFCFCLGISLLLFSPVSVSGRAERRIGGVAGRSIDGRGAGSGLRRLMALEAGCFIATGGCGRVDPAHRSTGSDARCVASVRSPAVHAAKGTRVCACHRLLVLATTIAFLFPLASAVVMGKLLHGGSARGMAGTATRLFAGVTLAACAYDALAFLWQCAFLTSCMEPCMRGLACRRVFTACVAR